MIGGGTSGAPAGIAAARQGAKTLVVEYLNSLGGVGTLGLVGGYYHGNRVGFTKEIDAAVGGRGWNIEKKMECHERVYINLYGRTREQREEMGIDNLPENLKLSCKDCSLLAYTPKLTQRIKF